MEKWLIILIAILSSIIVLYIIYVLISFFFVIGFSKKMNTEIESLSVSLYQKANILKELNLLMAKFVNNNEVVQNFIKEDMLNEYQTLDVKDIKELNNKFNNVFNEFKNILINNRVENYKKVSLNFNLYEDLEKRFFITSQIYNTNVVAFNYWRNLMFTKWVKKLFGIKEKESIL